MSDELNKITDESPFDQIKHVTSKGGEYWRARELQVAFGYSEWDKFEKNVLAKAEIACKESGEVIENHIRLTAKMVEVGSGAIRETRDYFLSRTGCYLVAMNADSSKRVIAEAQTYFAKQTLKQERQDKLTDEQKRIGLRNRVKDGNTILNQAAHERGVENFGKFQNAGYRGLYDGYAVADLKRKKGIPNKDGLLDCVGREELAANEFRITQTETRLRTETIDGEDHAIEIHHDVGKKVRKAIQDIGGIMPEHLKAEQNISKLLKKPENKAFAQSLKSPDAAPELLKRPSITPQSADAKWKSNTLVQVCGVSNNMITPDGTGFQNFPNLEAAREVFPDLDTHRNGARFTQAMGNPERDVMRFETWLAYDLYSQ